MSMSKELEVKAREKIDNVVNNIVERVDNWSTTMKGKAWRDLLFLNVLDNTYIDSNWSEEAQLYCFNYELQKHIEDNIKDMINFI
jgi:hypothetical protein